MSNEEGRKCVTTQFIYGYMAKDRSDSERGNPLPPPRGLLFLISDILYAPPSRQNSSPVVKYWLDLDLFLFKPVLHD